MRGGGGGRQGITGQLTRSRAAYLAISRSCFAVLAASCFVGEVVGV